MKYDQKDIYIELMQNNILNSEFLLQNRNLHLEYAKSPFKLIKCDFNFYCTLWYYFNLTISKHFKKINCLYYNYIFCLNDKIKVKLVYNVNCIKNA